MGWVASAAHSRPFVVYVSRKVQRTSCVRTNTRRSTSSVFSLPVNAKYTYDGFVLRRGTPRASLLSQCARHVFPQQPKFDRTRCRKERKARQTAACIGPSTPTTRPPPVRRSDMGPHAPGRARGITAAGVTETTNTHGGPARSTGGEGACGAGFGARRTFFFAIFFVRAKKMAIDELLIS